MIFETLEAVPTPVKPFYTTEVVSEPTGETVEQEYTYTDDEGVEQTGTRMVPEYHDVTYVVELPRVDLKSWDFVEQVTKPEFKVYCIQKACEAEEWEFHDNYITWFSSPPSEPVRARNEDGTYIPDDTDTDENEAWENGYTQEMYDADLIAWQDSEPVNIATDSEVAVAEYTLQNQQKQAKDYLAKTDWMLARKVETGQDVGEDILLKRNEARLLLDNTFVEPPFTL